MIKKCYYLLAVPIICLLFGITAFAGETYTWYQINSNLEANYISAASLPTTYNDWEWGDNPSVGSGMVIDGYYGLDWNFNNSIEILGNVGKFVYGVLFIEYDIYIPNPNSNIWEIYGGVISAGQSYISETLKIIPVIMTQSSNHYKYRIEYIFDGYQVQGNENMGVFISGPDMNIKMRLLYDGTSPAPPNNGVNPTGTITIKGNNIRFEETPLNHGLAALFAEGIDYSDKVDLMLQYLYDIKMNDLQYYQSLTSQISSLVADNQYQSERLRLILSNMINGFIDVQTVLDLFPSYRTEVLQYWQQLLEMNATQSSEASEIESQYQDKENQSATLVADLGSLNMPSISVGDLDILARTDPTQKANFFGLLSIITNNSFITTLLLIVCTGAIVGFILYGKKS